jgi:hypothetical protein
VAELADAHDSGSCARNGVEVQVLSSAPTKSIGSRSLAEASRSDCRFGRV